jgi:D-tagatose-1,6-bisphosphate aldolase subunit GatZ/KbaZ
MKELLNVLREHKLGRGAGIYSVCSAHPLVLEAALRHAQRRGRPLLVEATCNQVNQYGGYTGMQPAEFKSYVDGIATRAAPGSAGVLLGGDHLGPSPWRAENTERALEKSRQLVADYVTAGFRKIHLDCSMSCGGDPAILPEELIAGRAAQLAGATESAWRAAGGEPPVYVIGTEVPTPGGAAEALGALEVTAPAAVTETLAAHRQAFRSAGLDDVWERVVALVVQPGVEFDNYKVIDFQPARARELARRIESEPGLIYEAHSTDYQSPQALAALVREHFAILKVGPALTFALRAALWALVAIERELGIQPRESLKDVAIAAMRRDPRHWRTYYTEPLSEGLDLQYSLSDRIRYYWAVPEVLAACEALLLNLSRRPIPLALLDQYLPAQYRDVRAGALANEPRGLALDAVARVLEGYAAACDPGSGSD